MTVKEIRELYPNPNSSTNPISRGINSIGVNYCVLGAAYLYKKTKDIKLLEFKTSSFPDATEAAEILDITPEEADYIAMRNDEYAFEAAWNALDRAFARRDKRNAERALVV